MSEYNETVYENEYDETEVDKIVDEYENGTGYDPEEKVIYDDIMDKSIGLDEFGNPKAGFGVEIGEFDCNTSAVNIKNNMHYYNPAINITRTGDMVMFDFIYKNRTDSDLRQFWALLCTYGKNFEKALKEDNGILPFFRIQIVPNYYGGKFSMVLVTPMYWVLQPETPTSEINTIRIVFQMDSVAFVEGQGYDTKDILADIEREQMQNDYITEAIERKREEEEEYQNERNARIEEMRRNKEY